MRKLNKPLLRKLARKLRRLRHEKHFKQREWATKTACGTAACIAGHVVVAAGYKLTFASGEKVTGTCQGKDGAHGIEDLAMDILGLDVEAASRLFAGHPERASVWGDAETAWPVAFAKRWRSRKERPSRIAADLLDAIADTNGKILA